EADELRWYLESYYLWPTGVFKERAERIEAQLPKWGLDLYTAALAKPAAWDALTGWQHAAGSAERRFSVLIDPDLPDGASKKQHADAQAIPFDVIHFDGHGVYDRAHGLVALCFEDANDAAQLTERKMDLIHAAKLAAMIRDHRIPLVFLKACQTATVEDDPTASVAAKLLEEGVASVVAMSHSVLVETAQRFVQAFYAELARG